MYLVYVRRANVHASSDWYTMQENNTDHLAENAPPRIRIGRNLAQRALHPRVHLLAYVYVSVYHVHMCFSRFNTLRAVVERMVELERFVILRDATSNLREHISSSFLTPTDRRLIAKCYFLSYALRRKLNVAVFVQLFGSNDFPLVRVQFFFSSRFVFYYGRYSFFR